MLFMLVALGFLGVFTVLSLAQFFGGKLPALAKAAEKIRTKIEVISIAAFVYSVLFGILAPFLLSGAIDIFAGFVAAIVTAGMTLPHTFERLAKMAGDRLNPAIRETIHEQVQGIGRNDKATSVAAIASLLLLIYAILA